MRFVSLRLLNYVGIYNGLDGLDEIFIDFSKCKYSTILIKGKNGSGKSTILGALHPLPDDNGSFIPNREARKEVVIDSHGILYKIKCVHSVKSDGSRATTKAYISKVVDGETIDLNSNGNVSSFKEVIYSELSLDPNFISLSKLSSEDKGIVEKTPTERKKFVNCNIDRVEVYNNMNKTLTKRATTFKSMNNRIISKIDSIGDEEQLLSTLNSLENRINKMIEEKDNLIEELSGYKSRVSILDPNRSIQNKYEEIYNTLKVFGKEIDDIDSKINKKSSKLEISPDINIVFNANSLIKEKINILNNEISILDSEISNMLLDLEESSKIIERKNARLLTITQDNNFQELKTGIYSNTEKLNNILDTLKSVGFNSDINITKDECIVGVNTIQSLKEMIDVLKSNEDNIVIESVLDKYYTMDVNSIILEISNKKSDIINLLNAKNIELRTMYSMKELSSKLSIRPEDCSIDECPFIKDSVSAALQWSESDIKSLEDSIREMNDSIIEIDNNLEFLNKVNICKQSLSRIIRSIDNNGGILRKLPYMDGIINIESFLDRIRTNDNFNELDALSSMIEIADLIEEYNITKNILMDMKSEYNKYSNKEELVNEILNDIEEMNSNIRLIDDKILEKRNNLESNKSQLVELTSKSELYDELLLLLNSKISLEKEKAVVVSEYYAIQDNILKIKEYDKFIIDIQGKINDINSQLTPIINDRDEINHSIKLLKEYKSELDTYSTKYEMIDVLKRYSTPSKGIQVLYIKLYLNKTLSLTNELVSNLFDGRFTLLPYVVDDKEFRIPCIGDGLPRNDISDLSNAERSMISMIVSFVLMKQSSSEYNIILLDEIDAPLDESNRMLFISIMDRLKQILGIDQCIMISHSIEANYDSCDLILLKTDPGQDFKGNVIFKY